MIVNSLPKKMDTNKSMGKANKIKEIRQRGTMCKTLNTRPLKQRPS